MNNDEKNYFANYISCVELVEKIKNYISIYETTSADKKSKLGITEKDLDTLLKLTKIYAKHKPHILEYKLTKSSELLDSVTSRTNLYKFFKTDSKRKYFIELEKKSKAVKEDSLSVLESFLAANNNIQPYRYYKSPIDARIAKKVSNLNDAYIAQNASIENLQDIENLKNQFITTLRELRKSALAIKALEVPSEFIFYLSHKDKGAEKESLHTSITTDYRKNDWKIDRICLDGMQNHLPNDSGASECFLGFEIDNKWYDYIEAKKLYDKGKKITKVAFGDNGSGYDIQHLQYLFSTKAGEASSVGQNGEGMKMAAVASIRYGLDIEFQSKNWSAKAIGKNVSIKDFKNETSRDIEILCYRQFEHENEIVGSRTIFNNPINKLVGNEFVEYALNLPEKMLDLQKGYHPEYTLGDEEIVSTTKPGSLFVKNVFVTKISSIFSYNFNNVDLVLDRNQLKNQNPETLITDFLLKLDSKTIIKKIILYVFEHKEIENSNYYEQPIEFKFVNKMLNSLENGNVLIEKWKDAFIEVFQENQAKTKEGKLKETVLRDNNFKIPDSFKEKLNDYNVIELPKSWFELFTRIGILSDKQVLPTVYYTTMDTNIGVEYAKFWNEQRVCIDAIQNHLPADCRGNNVVIRFQSKDGQWHSFEEFENYSNENIIKIKILDDGQGYDFENLHYLSSNKNPNEASSGKFGEGTKMIALALLRMGSTVEYRSKGWKAVAGLKEKVIEEGRENEHKVKYLSFDVTTTTEGANSKILSDGDQNRLLINNCFVDMVSSTTIVNPNSTLIDEFRTADRKVLKLQDYNPILRSYNNSIISYSGGKVFVRELFINDNFNLKYSYHFEDLDIDNRDRKMINDSVIKDKIRILLQNCRDVSFITNFLSDAEDQAKSGNLTKEFMTDFEISEYCADEWLKAFQQRYDAKTAIRKMSDQDMNVVHMAQHVNLNMVTLPDTVAKALTTMRTREGKTIPSYQNQISKMRSNIVSISSEDLTEYENFMISFLLECSRRLEKDNLLSSINVYEYPNDYLGPKAAGFGNSSGIMLERSLLNGDVGHLISIFVHEFGHFKTNAQDAEPAFRDYFTMLISKLLLESTPIDLVIIEELLNNPKLSDTDKKCFQDLLSNNQSRAALVEDERSSNR